MIDQELAEKRLNDELFLMLQEALNGVAPEVFGTLKTRSYADIHITYHRRSVDGVRCAREYTFKIHTGDKAYSVGLVRDEP